MGTNSALCKHVDAASAQVGISEIPTCPTPPALAFAPASVAARTIIGAVRRVSRVMIAQQHGLPLQMQTALVGVNDKFNFGWPVVAKY
jgi:hypothetical protein